MTDADRDDTNTFKLSSGVVLRIKKPAPYAMMEMAKDLEATAPQPPMIYVEEKGREQPNEDDPEYRRERDRFDAGTYERVLDMLIVTATKIEETPDGMFGPTSPDFDEWAEAAGIKLPEGTFKRYRDWVKHYAGSEDMQRLLIRLQQFAGVSEEDVQRAIAMFPSLAPRTADNGTPTERRRRVGHTEPAAGGGSGS